MSKRAFAPFPKASSSLTNAILFLILLTVLCAWATRERATVLPPGAKPKVTAIWPELREQTPYPFASPVPPAETTVLNSTYLRLDPTKPATAGSLAKPTPPGGGAWMWHPARPTVWVMPPGPYAVQGGGLVLTEDYCGGQAPIQSGQKARAAVLTGFPWARRQLLQNWLRSSTAKGVDCEGGACHDPQTCEQAADSSLCIAGLDLPGKL
jgi:hypothetical protein